LGQGFGEGRLEKTKGTIATNREPIPSNMAIRNNEEKTFSLIELGFAELAISPMGIPTKTVPTVIPKAVAFHIYEVCLFLGVTATPHVFSAFLSPINPNRPILVRNAP
jgi:hypothetical protein